ncbi:MAG: GNAT family N-acetyltransferase [Phormidesmis sp.]
MSASEVYKILAIRQKVFIVEQKCLYLDADGLDRDAWHLFGCDLHGTLIAYARLLPPNTRYKEPSIGRVIVSQKVRGIGLGRQLIHRCIEQCESEYPGETIRVSAQTYLEKFYRSFGFESVGQSYDDGGIEHIGMVKRDVGKLSEE